jgi:hypothetical protein
VRAFHLFYDVTRMRLTRPAASGVAIAAIALTAITVVLVQRARAKPFWHDEVYTLLESDLPVVTLWRACLDGIDLQPPLNAMITRGVHAITGTGTVATRVPPMAGFLAAAALLFVMARRRANVWIGLAAALALCLTPAWKYAIEARGYGLTLAWFAAALYGWSEAAAGRHLRRNWTIAAVALAAGVWSHYHAVLVFLPILAGEVVRQVRARRLSWVPWLALAAAVVLTAPLWPLALAASAQRATFWADPSLVSADEAYRYVAGGLLSSPAVRTGGLIVLAVALIEIARRIWRRDWPRRLPAHEVAAGMACLALPFAALTLGHWTHAFEPRYVVFATVAAALVVPLAVWACLPTHRVGDVLVATVMIAAAWPVVAAPVQREPDMLRDRFPMLVDWLRSPSPIALTGGVLFLETWYAMPEDARRHVTYLADAHGQKRDTYSDTVERGYLALARWTPVPVVELRDYVKQHPAFWLYALEPNWALHSLRLMPLTMEEQVRERDGRGRLIHVTTKPGLAHRASALSGYRLSDHRTTGHRTTEPDEPMTVRPLVR